MNIFNSLLFWIATFIIHISKNIFTEYLQDSGEPCLSNILSDAILFDSSALINYLISISIANTKCKYSITVGIYITKCLTVLKSRVISVNYLGSISFS